MEVVTSEKVGLVMCSLHSHCGGGGVEMVGGSFTSTWLMYIPWTCKHYQGECLLLLTCFCFFLQGADY